MRSGTARLTRGVLLALALAAPGAAAEEVGGSDGAIIESERVELEAGALESLTARLPEARRLLEQIDLRAITYWSDGLKVKGYLALPRDASRLPCVIFNRGGNREFGALTDARAASILLPLAARGYVVAASQYRGVAGGEGVEEFGGAELADVLNLIPLLESQPGADASRLGMYGWSRGGMMTYLALTETDRLAAAVVGAAPTDLEQGLIKRPGMEEVYRELIPNWETDRAAAAASRSALRWPERLHKRTPLLILHGSGDWRVDPAEALDMAQALFAAKHPFRLVFFEGGDHGLTEYREERRRLVFDWFDHYVRDGKSWPSLEPHGR